MSSFKERCLELRRNDFTLSEIMEATGRPKTSVFFHIRNLPLSPEKQKEVREIANARIRSFALLRKGKSVRGFHTFETWDRERLFIVSHLLFDGEMTYGACVYNNRSIKLVDEFERAMLTIYDFPPKKYLNQTSGVRRVSYFNVTLAKYLKEKSLELLDKIVGMDIEFKRVFLRSFFDDEGCMDFKVKRNIRRVRGYQKDRRMLFLVKDLLLVFGIPSYIRRGYVDEVTITGKQNLIKFREEINFSPGVRINGKRSNSVWKKSLEKRRILDKAIGSFQS